MTKTFGTKLRLMDMSKMAPWPITHNQKFRIALIVSIVFHFFGVLGILSPFQEWFLGFTPLVLLISASLLFWNHSKSTYLLNLTFLVVLLLGFTAEVIGVNTGLLFGNYFYGSNLGPKIFGVPITIGINWSALCLASTLIIKDLKVPSFLKILLGASIPVIIDFFIEPLAGKLDFWYWSKGFIPLSNYITWYLCSCVFVFLFLRSTQGVSNRFAFYFLVVQWIFFLTLNLFLPEL